MDRSKIARELKALFEHEKESYQTLRVSASLELKVSEKTLTDWASGRTAIPLPQLEKVDAFLRHYRWKTNSFWKLATSVSELLGIDGGDFASIDRYIDDNKPTLFRFARLKFPSGDIQEGLAKLHPLSDQPRMLDYSYTTDKGKARSFKGPIWESDNILHWVAIGGHEAGDPHYFRMAMLKVLRKPFEGITFGIALTEFIEQRIPIASPVALVPMKENWKLDKSVYPENQQIHEKLRAMASNGLVSVKPIILEGDHS